MFVHHPQIAKRWSKEYGVSKNLPAHVKKKTKSYSAEAIKMARAMGHK